MTSLREAVLALLPAGTFEGEAPASATLPWRVVTIDVPTPVRRALAGPVHTRRARVRVTVAAANHQACHILAAQVVAALEFVTPAADEVTCGPLMHVSSRPITRDPQVTLPATNTSAFFTVLDFGLTVAASPTP
ncbi:tail completion protein gp17 [Cellulomonas gilvus]|uniref:Uncharacterized protein n=1 Tax=Cellulomonas gilvus (strain ATCC 13127 / NRRL B-14078) TaxID=593907 RepID=F8A2G0_CELGA|nr:DUF3168 domain-containing protein [Cellulomonas gilvus]AEI11817.1 hypothetical protein Celgi_1298 [Cellulomonas gilvus ATCC 13127]